MSDPNLDTMEDAIVISIIEKNKELLEVLPELSLKEAKRVIKNIGMFPAPVPPNAGNETIATETIYAIKDLQIELAIIKIGKSQLEKENEND